MSEQQTYRRRQYVVNKRMQVTTSMQLMAVLMAIGAFVVLGVEFMAKDAVEGMTVEDSRRYFLFAIAIYFSLAIGVLGVQAILILHRVAGPAKVIERAVVGMQQGEYEHRLSLRKKDYLKSLANAVAAMRDGLKAREDKLAELLDCIDEGDLAGAKEIAVQLRTAPKPAETPAEEPDPDDEPEEKRSESEAKEEAPVA